MKEVEKIILKGALANAISHKGKARTNAVLGFVLGQKPELKLDIPKLRKEIEKVVLEINKLSFEEQKRKLHKIWPEFFAPKKTEKKELPPLPKAKVGKVVMRFEPSPSGPLHIGHAYTLCLNAAYCKKYRGKLILRIADTNPLNIFEPAYDMIPEDARWVTSGKIDEVVYQSNRLERYYFWAEKLLELGKAYVCICEPTKWKELMIKSKPCPCRELGMELQLERWRAMLDGELEEGKAVVRIKTDLMHKNPAMRDWPALRIQASPHPKTGKKYRVWPLMNFAVAIDDHEMGITHAIRMKEHRDNELRQKFIYDYLGWKMPMHLYVGAINFKDLKLSTTQTRQAIKAGKYSGWNDVRLPFLRALRRRGYQPEAFMRWAIDVGPTEADKTVSQLEFFELFDAYNREIIDPIANRYFFVPKPIEIRVKDAPKIAEVSVPIHPDKKVRRKIKVRERIWVAIDDLKKLRGKEVRLIDLYNVILDKRARFTSLPNKELPRIQWVSEDNIPVEVLMPNGTVVEGLAEGNIRSLKIDEIIQFVRFGFCRLDNKSEKFTFCFAHR